MNTKTCKLTVPFLCAGHEIMYSIFHGIWNSTVCYYFSTVHSCNLANKVKIIAV